MDYVLNSPKLSMKDSFDDDEISDDVEDEVFIRDGKNGFKFDDEIGVKRPLMAPRRKFKYNSLHVPRSKRPFYKRLKCSCSYGISFILIFSGIVFGVFIIYNLIYNPFVSLRQWTMEKKISDLNIIPCTDFKTEHIWHQSFPFLRTEAALTTFDANGDDIADTVVGFSTGIEESEMAKKCSLFDITNGVCGGGAMAIDGRTGSVLWRYWTRKDVLFVDCSENVNADKTKDCLISGKGGVLCIVDGKTGLLVWEFTKSNKPYVLDLYTAQYIYDQTEDGYADVLISHTSDQSSFLIILNGKNGNVVGRISIPDRGSTFTVPRLFIANNNTYVVFTTGSIETSGALYLIPLEAISRSDSSRSKTIWRGYSGITSGILIADMNGDNVEDIVFTSSYSLNLMDGRDFSTLWNLTFKESGYSQILMGPTPAYFNNDAFPDLLITNMVGSSFPNYFFSETRIASGDSGEFLLDEALIGSGEVTSPAIAISFSGIGNDLYLYWSSSCGTDKSNQKGKFSFFKETTLYDKTHADLCKLRFNTSSEIQLFVLNQHIEPPGILLYSSKSELEFKHSDNEKVSKLKPFNIKKNPKNIQMDKDQHPSRLQFSSQSGEKKNSLNFGKFMGGRNDKSQWDYPYDDENIPILPSVNLGELAMRYEGSYQDDINHNDGRDERMSYGKEMKRDAPYPEDLLPRARSTATLVDAINATGIDIIFSTYTEPSAKGIRILTKKELDCIQKKIQLQQSSNNLNSLELEMAEEHAERACVADRWGSDRVNSEEGGDSDGSSPRSNFALRMGQ